MKKVILWIVALLLAVPSVSFAGDAYFVSKNGSNSNTGLSWAQAWLTAGKADSTLSTHGDTIVFGAGTWTNTMLRVPSGGSPSTWQIYCCSSYYEYLIGSITYAQAVSARLSGGAYKSQITSGQPMTSHTFYQVNGSDSVWQFNFTEDHTIGWTTRGPYSFSEGWAANKADSQFRCNALTTSASDINALVRGRYVISGSGASWTMYYIPFGGGNPNSNGHTYWASGVPTIPIHARGSGATKYTKIWGLEIKHGMQGSILFMDNNRGSCSTFIEYCHVAMAGQEQTENAGTIMSRSNRVSDSTQYQRWVIIRNDSVGWAKSIIDGDNIWNGNIVTYDAWHWRIDSSVIYGNAYYGVHFKNDDYVNQVTHTYKDNQVTNSYIFNVTRGINIGEIPCWDSIYGNVITADRGTGGDRFGISFEPAHGDHPDSLWKYRTFIGNNTFFNCQRAVFDMIWPGANRAGDSTRFIYNVIVNHRSATESDHQGVFCNRYSNGFTNDLPGDGKGILQLDSNMYWNDSPYVAFQAYWNTATRNWGTWKATYGWDTNSDTATNPNLDDPNNTALSHWARFGRTGEASQMNRTYGGKTWTVFGAVQPTGGASQSCPGYSQNSPSNGATVTDLPVNLLFNVSDADDDSVLYRLFLSTANPPVTQVASDTIDPPQSNLTYNATGLLDNTTYYWRLILADTCDSRAEATCVETTGVYSFTTDTVTVVTPSRRGILIKPGGPE